jgi:hypothetical protein
MIPFRKIGYVRPMEECTTLNNENKSENEKWVDNSMDDTKEGRSQKMRQRASRK